MNIRTKLLAPAIFCVSLSSASVFQPIGVYNEAEAVGEGRSMAVVKVNVTAPEGITPFRIVGFCMENQYTKKEAKLNQDVYFQLNEGRYYFCIDGIGPDGETYLLVTPEVDITGDMEP